MSEKVVGWAPEAEVWSSTGSARGHRLGGGGGVFWALCHPIGVCECPNSQDLPGLQVRKLTSSRHLPKVTTDWEQDCPRTTLKWGKEFDPEDCLNSKSIQQWRARFWPWSRSVWLWVSHLIK
jgi:hypothetical protein